MFHIYGRRGGCGPRAYYGIWMHGGGRHGWGRGMSRGEGGGRRRVFDSGELKLVLLKLIADQPRHGYDLIRAIEERTGGAYAPSPGVVYPTLTLLDDMGLIGETKSEGAKKQFAITAAGTVELEAKAAEVRVLFARLDEMGAARAKTDSAPVRRAMGNLRAVLQDRLSADGVSMDTLHDVAALLDEAAQKIERL
jgi:DNA-binding PadR family transcriptional regulator